MKAKTVNEYQNFERGQDPKRSLDIGIVSEDAMGGVSGPISTLGNTPGMGNAQPAASASTGALDGAPKGSGDKFDASIGPMHVQEELKDIFWVGKYYAKFIK